MTKLTTPEMLKFLPYAWFQGECIPFEEARVSIATHALHYGTAAFGGMRAIPDPLSQDRILLFRPDRHAKRLSQSAKFLLTELTEETVLNSLTEFLVANNVVILLLLIQIKIYISVKIVIIYLISQN